MTSVGSVVHGDAADVLRGLDVDPSRTVVITDPPWPNCEHVPINGSDDAAGTWASVADLLPGVADRLTLWLGGNTDPRGFVDRVPAALPFLTTVWLRFIPPGYRGPIMASADLAYVFGRARLPTGKRVLPSEAVSTSSQTAAERQALKHPCPRSSVHARFLVRWYAAKCDLIIDPFCGSGTTLVAAAELGIPFLGIDNDERWVAEARDRVSRAERQQLLSLDEPQPSFAFPTESSSEGEP